jgi:hypothetical protein
MAKAPPNAALMLAPDWMRKTNRPLNPRARHPPRRMLLRCEGQRDWCKRSEMNRRESPSATRPLHPDRRLVRRLIRGQETVTHPLAAQCNDTSRRRG